MSVSVLTAHVDRLVTRLADLADDTGCNIAVAESLTGGQLASAMASAKYASEWFRGGIVAYHPEIKHNLLNTPPGPVVTPETAEAMARSAADLFGSHYAVALTGVGGPGPDEHKPAGTVYLATYASVGGSVVERHQFSGDPAAVMTQSIETALAALIARIRCQGSFDLGDSRAREQRSTYEGVSLF